MLKRPLAIAAIGMLAAASVATAQDHGMDHGMHGDHVMGATPVATEPGQSAFAAIQEVVDILTSDPRTDWSSVDIEGLRQHLIDMDNVTMRATVTQRSTDDGTTFIATSDDPGVTASIQRMVRCARGNHEWRERMDTDGRDRTGWRGAHGTGEPGQDRGARIHRDHGDRRPPPGASPRTRQGCSASLKAGRPARNTSCNAHRHQH